MKKFLPYLLQAAFVIAGAAGGLWLKTGFGGAESVQDASAHEEAVDAQNSHGEEKTKKAGKKEKHASKAENKEKKKGKKSKGDHGGGHGGGKGDDTPYGFLKFSRQFVVPVLNAGGVQSLVVMDINIEVPPSETEAIYLLEPRLRDAMLDTLLSLSNEGAFESRLLASDNRERIRNELLESARSIIGENALNVLILNITRQDV